MIKLRVKPLSVNEAWKGQKWKTDKYKSYEKLLLAILPTIKIPSGKLQITYNFGFSSPLCDSDNPVKLCNDILQKRYGFNDRDVFKLIITKEITPKGQEFIEFKIESL